MTDYREQVALALRAAGVASPTSYSWFGHRSRPLPAALRSALAGGVARAYLVEQLQGVLYRSFYSQGAPVPLSALARMPARPDPAFVDALSRSNTGRGGWQSGWRVERSNPRDLVAVRDGLRVRVRTADCRPRPGARTANAPMSVRRPKEQRSAQPGFYTALGDAELPGTEEHIEVRVYFHLTAEGAVPFVAGCTRLLNRARVPFVLKVVDNPAGFLRCDAGVLYLGEGDFSRARRHLRAIAALSEAHLCPDVPAFAKPLGAGVAVGEHRPRLGGSFGSSRCGLVAEAIVDAHERGAVRLDDRLDAVAQRFAGNGLDLAAPYLVSGSLDRYVL
jgi:hypothetical protein